MIYGTLYATLTTVTTLAKVAGKSVPPVVLAPALMGGTMLANMYDFAYGSKLQRVVAEAEYIMDHEKHRMVPPKQALFHKFYEESELDKIKNVGAVGTYVPSFLPWSR